MIEETLRHTRQTLRTAETTVSRTTMFLATTIGPFRTELAEHQLGNIHKLNTLLAEDYSAIFVIPHFSLRDAYATIPALGLEVPALHTRPMLYPIAQHIYEKYKTVLETSSHVLHTSMAQITTNETKEKEAEYEAAGKPIPWEVHSVGYGNIEYAQKAIEIVNAGGFVVIAPQGTRQPHLQEFPGRPMQLLLRQIRDVKKVALCVMGLELDGATTYTKEKVGGFNIGKKFTTTVGYVGTREDLAEQATAHGWTIDKEVLYQMNEVAPQPYKARDKEGVLIFP